MLPEMKNTLTKTQFKNLLYAVMNHGYGAENSVEGEQWDKGVDAVVELLFPSNTEHTRFFREGISDAMQLYVQVESSERPQIEAERLVDSELDHFGWWEKNKDRTW